MKHVSRKIMHGVLDLLPILIIGVFAIYSHRHEPTQSITYAQNELLDFNQQAKPFDDVGWSTINANKIVVGNDVTITATANYGYSRQPIPLVDGHKYLCSFYVKLTTPNADIIFGLGDSASGYYVQSGVFKDFSTISNTDWNTINVIGTYTKLGVETYIVFSDIRTSGWDAFSIRNLQVHDLTQMYGAGNEPALVSEFTDDFPLSYYPYTLSEKILNKNVSEITYNDTDIGSQMVYALYNPIDKYFNLNKVANFEQVYDFFQVQFFNGNAPISIFIVWNIILYQFIMDIIFLVYMVFMFIIDFIGGMLDFMFRKSFGGAN